MRRSSGGMRGTSSIRRSRTRRSIHYAVLGLALVIALTGIAQAAPADARSPRSSDGRGKTSTLPQSRYPAQASVRAATTLRDRQRAAVRRLQVAARNLRWVVDAVVRVPNDADFLKVIQAQFNRAELILAIRNARSVGLGGLANRYQRVLEAEVKRLNESTAFSDLLRNASAYGEQVAQKVHEDHPSLSPTVLGNIAVNAANWYGNNALLQTTLRAAKQKNRTVYEFGVTAREHQ